MPKRDGKRIRGLAPETPFGWFNKSATRAIRDSAKCRSLKACLLTYFVMTEEASNKESSIFEASMSYLARKTGLSVTCIQGALDDLERTGVFMVQRSKVKGRRENETNTYKLVSFSSRKDSQVCQNPKENHTRKDSRVYQKTSGCKNQEFEKHNASNKCIVKEKGADRPPRNRSAGGGSRARKDNPEVVQSTEPCATDYVPPLLCPICDAPGVSVGKVCQPCWLRWQHEIATRSIPIATLRERHQADKELAERAADTKADA
jgi:hypothetical protein